MAKYELSYFYGQQSDQFNFVKIPKPLLYDPMYKEVKPEEALLYSMLLDRMQLSMKNGWFDDLGRAYIYCSIETVMEFSYCGKNKACDMLKKLDAIGLIDKVLIPGRGLKIYVKNFIPKDAANKFTEKTHEDFEDFCEEENLEETTVDSDDEASRISNHAVYNSNTAVCNSNSQIPENKLEAVCFSNTNKTNINNTEYSENISNQTLSAGSDEDDERYAARVRENIALDDLLIKYPYDEEFFKGLYDIIVETVISKRDRIVISGDDFSMVYVRSKFLKLNMTHMEYVKECWDTLTEKPRNMKKYLLAVLFNAASTMDAYYQAEYSCNRDNGLKH